MENRFLNIAGGAIAGALAAILVIYGTGNFGTSIISAQEETNEQEEKKVEEYDDGKYTEEDLVIQAVKDSSPAVVSIIIKQDVPKMERVPSPMDDFFGDDPFFNFPQYKQNGTEKKEVGGGSGFIVSEDGYIVTNKHVVNLENSEYAVFLNDGTEYEGKILAKDPLNDIAILKIEPDKKLPFLKFGDSEGLVVGQTVIAIGNPLLEFSNSVSVGVVSGLSRSITANDLSGHSEQLDNVIQTDAAINPGNSGGPLLNLKGEVIGVNVAVASAENIGFSLPANMVGKIVTSVKETGEIIRPYLGVRYVPITKALKETNNLSVDYGVLVIRGVTADELAVIPGSPADKAGIVENDIILEVDGKKLDIKYSLARIVAEKEVGDQLKLKVLSKGEEKEVTVNLERIKN